MNRFIPQFEPLIKEEWAERVKQQILSGWIGPGKAVEEFENKLKQVTNTNHVISTTSGTAAIMLAIHALNIPKGKKILFPSYTFLAGANAARFMGYEVELCDINLETMCLHPAFLEEKLKSNARYINWLENSIGCAIFVNHNGYVGEDVLKIKHICDCYNIPMIEDSSQALGMHNAGTIGDIGIFSFSVPKIVSTGQGGAMITNNPTFARRAKEMRDHGDNWRKDKIHKNTGINLKFDDMHASYGLAQLEELDMLVARDRFRVQEEYKKHLGENNIYHFDQRTTWMVILKTFACGRIIELLAANNIQAVQYYKPISSNPPYASESEYNNAKRIYNQALYLPSSLNLTNEEIKLICDLIKTIDYAI